MNSLSEWIRMIYGLIMGTSTPIYEPSYQNNNPLKFTEVATGIWLFEGGTCQKSLVLRSDGELLLINTHKGNAAEEIYHFTKEKFPNCAVTTIINTRCDKDFSGGNYLYPERKHVYVGDYPRVVLIREMGDRSLPNHIVSGPESLSFGSEVVELKPLGHGHIGAYLKKSGLTVE